MYLKELLDGLIYSTKEDILALDIKGVAYDSREVKSGYLFVALKGRHLDGSDYIQDAIKKGAVAVVTEKGMEVGRFQKIPTIEVAHSREFLAEIAIKYYREPFEGINLIGITGTNGKTTTSYLIESVLKASSRMPGVIGTVNDRYKGVVLNTSITTPGSLELMRTLRTMADAGVSDVIIEVSSHALSQGRTKGCPFKVVVFTNFSRDHLDYHNSMDEYFKSKSLLFKKQKDLENSGLTKAVINADDPKGKELIELTEFPYITYGLSKDCDIRAEDIRIEKEGITGELVTPLGVKKVKSNLIGDFNLYNILAATGTGLSLGISLEDIAAGISMLNGVPGRLELIKNNDRVVVVDYAHTPDALEKAIVALKPLYKRIITVFGCGGDRDRGKRFQMGLIAGMQSDFVIITSDNPRTEDPMAIALEIEKGVRQSGLEKRGSKSLEFPAKRGYVINIDRRSAITQAVSIAGKDTVVLVAGKGHEDYQIIGNERLEFDDRKIAEEVTSGEY